MRKQYVMIDFENVQPESLALLDNEHVNIWLFLGEKQTRVSTELVRSLQPFGKRAEYLSISGSGPNAVDFHIAYYIGRLAAEDAQAEFHIVSKDAGFDPLVRHLSKSNLHVKRVVSIDEIPIVKKALANSIGAQMTRVIDRLHQIQKAPPRSLKTLASTISSFFQPALAADDVERLVVELQRKKYVLLQGRRVEYALPAVAKG